jgi:hypothetical protein
MTRVPKTVSLVGVYRFPVPLGVTQGSLGKTFAVEIAGISGKATFPTLAWSDSEPRLVMPPLDDPLPRAIDHYTRHEEPSTRWTYWGFATKWHPGKRTVRSLGVWAVVLKFSVPRNEIAYSDYEHGLGAPAGEPVRALYTHIDDWFDRLRTWLEAAVDQDADPEQPLASVRTTGRGLILFTNEDAISLPSFPNHLTITAHEEELLTLPRFRKAAAQANAGNLPSDAHLLLRDGRAALRRRSYRRAAIDAGSAVEITLAAFNNRVTKLKAKRGFPTLGWYVYQPPIIGGTGLARKVLLDQLVNVRNNAIHENVVPGHVEAARALELAKTVVEAFDPLPL